MVLTLIRKEWIEHGWLFALLLPTALFGFLLVFLGAMLNEAGSTLDAVRFYGLTLHLLLALVICNRLVVQEYSAKTQLFLEGLPISRVAMVATKYVLGIALVGSVLTVCFLISLAAAVRGELLEGRFVLIMVSRLVVYTFVCYSFFFMMGFLGRYRIALYVGLLFTMMILSQVTAFDIREDGPLELLNDQFAFERNLFPIGSLVGCTIAGVAFVAISFLMGLAREGSVAGMLAERMSHREKLFVTVVLIMILFAGTAIDAKQTPDPYYIPDAHTESGDGVTVHVETVTDSDAASQLARHIHYDMTGVKSYLNIDRVPELFVVNRRDLDADRFEPARIKNATGTLFRANYVSEDWTYEKFRPFLIDVCLSHVSHYNAIYEPQCWVLEGFSEYWPRKQRFSAEWTMDAAVDRRAAYGASLGCVEADVGQWYTYRERVGEPIARSVACSGLVLAERLHGKEKLHAFLKDILRTDQPNDLRADLVHWARPINVVWRDTMQSDYREFLSRWMTELQSMTQMFEQPLASVPRLTATSKMIRRSSATYSVEIIPVAQPAPGDGKIEIRHKKLSIYDTWASDRKVESQIEIYKADEPIRLDDTFSAGGRLRWTASTHAPSLECDVISGWQRQEID